MSVPEIDAVRSKFVITLIALFHLSDLYA